MALTKIALEGVIRNGGSKIFQASQPQQILTNEDVDFEITVWNATGEEPTFAANSYIELGGKVSAYAQVHLFQKQTSAITVLSPDDEGYTNVFTLGLTSAEAAQLLTGSAIMAAYLVTPVVEGETTTYVRTLIVPQSVLTISNGAE